MEIIQQDESKIVCKLDNVSRIDDEFLKRAQRFNAQVKKILITAFMSEAVISEAFRLGVHEFIEKPFTPEELEEALVRVLKKR